VLTEQQKGIRWFLGAYKIFDLFYFPLSFTFKNKKFNDGLITEAFTYVCSSSASFVKGLESQT
jgi:hypothetical protein